MDEELDRRPGTGDFVGPGGVIHKSVHDLRLEGDGTEHLAVIYLVGGASRMPLLHRKLETIFGSRLFDVQIVGMEPTEAIVMGLARHQPLDRIELRNPNWAVQAEFANGRSTPDVVEVYQPYAPLMRMGLRATTSNYRTCVPVPADCRGGNLSMVFRPMTGRQGERWDTEQLPPGVDAIDVVITLFGDVAVWAGSQRLFSDQRTPFSLSDGMDWLPKSWQQRWREEIHRTTTGSTRIDGTDSAPAATGRRASCESANAPARQSCIRVSQLRQPADTVDHREGRVHHAQPGARDHVRIEADVGRERG